MTEKAYRAFQHILENRRKAQSVVIDGYRNFLFLNVKGLPKVAGDYKSMLKGMVKNIINFIKINFLILHHILLDILIVPIWQIKV